MNVAATATRYLKHSELLAFSWLMDPERYRAEWKRVPDNLAVLSVRYLSEQSRAS